MPISIFYFVYFYFSNNYCFEVMEINILINQIFILLKLIFLIKNTTVNWLNNKNNQLLFNIQKIMIFKFISYINIEVFLQFSIF